MSFEENEKGAYINYFINMVNDFDFGKIKIN